MTNNVYLYVLNTLSDWEPAYIISELNSGRGFKKNAGKYLVKTFAVTKDPVVTMGGITILPDFTVDDIVAENTSLLLLPGADTWMNPIHQKVLDKAKEFLNEEIIVAGICGATEALAAAGILNDHAHTSNGLDILKKYPAYSGEKLYRNQSAVADGNLITAPGAAPLEFAYEVLKKMNVFTPTVLDNWYGYYKTQDSKYIAALMQELSQQ